MANKLSLDYYYGNESEQYSFYRIPRVLFTHERYKGLSCEAKVLYGLMLDRMSLSRKKGWIDDLNRVYIFFTMEAIQQSLNCGHNKAIKLLAELDSEKGIGLIQRKKQGMGRPSIIYVLNFVEAGQPEEDIHEPELIEDEEEVMTSEKGKSYPVTQPEPSGDGGRKAGEEVMTSQKGNSRLPEIGSHDFPKSEGNYINNSYTELSYTHSFFPSSGGSLPPNQSPEEYRSSVCEKIEYDDLCKTYDREYVNGLVEIMVDVFRCNAPTIRVADADRSPGEILTQLARLGPEHISFVLDCMAENTTSIRNMKSYLLTALYNAPILMNLQTASQVNHDLQGKAGAALPWAEGSQYAYRLRNKLNLFPGSAPDGG